MISNTAKPVNRSSLRRKLGKGFYILKRKIYWRLSGDDFADNQEKEELPFLYKTHQSLLLRPLKDVNMQLQYNKVDNLKLAIEKIDGLVLKPGQTFSFWKRVGNPSKQKGYKPGLVLNQGKIDQGYGGGLCQLANMLFWMTLHTPLTIKERYRHGFDVFPDVNRKIPFGAGATVAYNYIDLQITNNTAQTFQFKLGLSDTHLLGKVLSDKQTDVEYEVYEAAHEIKQTYWGGYTRHNVLNRKERDITTQKVICDEFLLQNQAIMMYNPLLPAYTPKDFSRP